MKRIIAAIMILVLAVTLSGCKEVPSFMPSYWDGLTKFGAKEYIQNALQEKYGEEFTVINTYLKGGTWDTSADLWADCSPKSDEDIVFDIKVLAIGEERVLRDTYVQSIVRQEMKNDIESVLSKYSEGFAVEIDVSGLHDEFDSGIRSAKDATVKNYSEALPDTNETSIWIALNKDNIVFQEKINYIVEEITSNLYLTHAFIHFYYVTDDIIKQCVEETSIYGQTDRLAFYRILYGHYPCDAFAYKGKENRLVQIEYADKDL